MNSSSDIYFFAKWAKEMSRFDIFLLLCIANGLFFPKHSYFLFLLNLYTCICCQTPAVVERASMLIVLLKLLTGIMAEKPKREQQWTSQIPYAKLTFPFIDLLSTWNERPETVPFTDINDKSWFTEWKWYFHLDENMPTP